MVIKRTKKKAPTYFLGGATWDGQHVYQEFITKGIWRSGWGSNNDQYRETLEQASVGDRIAIKKGLGQGAKKIQIRAIGEIIAIDLDEEFCTFYVKWLRSGMNRKVDCKGCFRTIHGPFSDFLHLILATKKPGENQVFF